MKRQIVTIIISAMAAIVANAQSAPALLVVADAESLATAGTEMSSTAFALSGDVFKLSANYGSWAPASANNSLTSAEAFYMIADKLVLSLEGKKLSDKIPTQMNNSVGVPIGSFTPEDLMMGFGVSYKLNSYLALGADAKMLNSSLSKELEANAYAADLSLVYKKDSFCAELGVSNLGTPLSYGDSSYALPSFAKIKLGYEIGGLRASTELDYLFSGAIMASLGAEYGIKDMVFLRAGYHYGDAAKAVPSFASCGLGLKFFGIKLNASYLLGSKTLGGTILFGLGYEF